MIPSKQKIVGLALGGGGARGCAHVGVIKALTEAGIPIHRVAGTSIGALVGGAYASGKIKEFEAYLLKMDVVKIMTHLDIALSNKGLLNGEKIKRILSENFIHKKIESAPLPFTAIAVDVQTGKEVRLRKGSLVDAIRASISIPGIFVPAQMKGRYLVDGGLRNPLPIDALRDQGVDLVIAVDLNKDVSFERRISKKRHPLAAQWHNWISEKTRPNLVDFLGNTITIMQQQITEARLQACPADFLIRPRLGRITLFDFQLAESMIAEGYRAAHRMIPEIKKALNHFKSAKEKR